MIRHRNIQTKGEPLPADGHQFVCGSLQTSAIAISVKVFLFHGIADLVSTEIWVNRALTFKQKDTEQAVMPFGS